MMRPLDLFYIDLVTRSWIAFWIMVFFVGFAGYYQEELRRLLERTNDWLRRWGTS